MAALTFCFLSTTDWDAPQFGSRQQIARLLAQRGHQVLFVDVARALHSLISAPADTRRAVGRMDRLRRIADGLTVYTPPPVLPIYYHPTSNAMSQRLLLTYLRRALRRLSWPRLDVLWTYWPNSAYLVGRLGERISVYHCIDALTAVKYPLTPPNAITEMEAELCRKVGIIFARTQELADDKRRYNACVQLLPGGVDLELFTPRAELQPTAALAAIPRPRAGFLGTVDNRLDVALLTECAARLQEVSFVFVGPAKPHLVDLRPLAVLPNVHFLPACSHAEAPSFYAGFDVGLIPYRLNPYTEGLSPLKLYEYLAMGVPVVATPLPYLRREQTHIRIAGEVAGFAQAIRDSIVAPPTPAQKANWRSVAAGYSWAQQVDQIEATLAPKLFGEGAV